MTFGITLKVWGEYACFTRPEFKSERVSYEVITPSAARGIIEAIHWKPAIRWIVDEIIVVNPINFENIRKNELWGKIPYNQVKNAMKGGDLLHKSVNDQRVQRASLLLRNICYVIKAHFELTDKAGIEDTKEKHYNIALRRMRQGQCYNQPYFGCREYPVNFELIEGDIPKSQLIGTQDLDIMLYDIDFKNNKRAIFFHPIMNDGVIKIQDCLKRGIS